MWPSPLGHVEDAKSLLAQAEALVHGNGGLPNMGGPENAGSDNIAPMTPMRPAKTENQSQQSVTFLSGRTRIRTAPPNRRNGQRRPDSNCTRPRVFPMPHAMTTHTCPVAKSSRRVFNPRRLALASLGVLSVGIGALGVFVPGLPTTVFLIIGSWCFARSCPWLETRLIRNRFFAPFLRALEPGAVMPRRARVIAICSMWVAILVSLAMLWQTDTFAWSGAAIAGAGLLGTLCIVRFRRGNDSAPADAGAGQIEPRTA